jgi:hypothetical protein
MATVEMETEESVESAVDAADDIVDVDNDDVEPDDSNEEELTN